MSGKTKKTTEEKFTELDSVEVRAHQQPGLSVSSATRLLNVFGGFGRLATQRDDINRGSTTPLEVEENVEPKLQGVKIRKQER